MSDSSTMIKTAARDLVRATLDTFDKLATDRPIVLPASIASLLAMKAKDGAVAADEARAAAEPQ